MDESTKQSGIDHSRERAQSPNPFRCCDQLKGADGRATSPLLHFDDPAPQIESDFRPLAQRRSGNHIGHIQNQRRLESKADREDPVADGCEIEEFFGQLWPSPANGLEPAPYSTPPKINIFSYPIPSNPIS